MLMFGRFRAQSLVVLVGLGLCSSGTAGVEPTGPVGTVTGVVGFDVELRRPGVPNQFVLLGQPLLPDDEIYVPSGHSAMVFLPTARSVLQINENSVAAFRNTSTGLEVRLANGVLRVLRSDATGPAPANSGLAAATPLGRCAMVAGVLEIAHRTGETAGASRSVFRLSSGDADDGTTVERIDGSQAAALPMDTEMILTPSGSMAPATALPATSRPADTWSADLPYSAARTHRLRVADDFRNDLVQRTALAAALAAPVKVTRPVPQSIIDQPAVQPPGPSQATRVIAPSGRGPQAGPAGGNINQFAQENLSNLLGLVPGRGPVPTAGPNSLIGTRH
jgi:hypothetical protein